MFPLGQNEGSDNGNSSLEKGNAVPVQSGDASKNTAILSTNFDEKSLKTLELASVCINVVLFLVWFALIMIQNFTSTIETSRMSTGLTQTVSMWMSPITAKRHVFDDMVFLPGVNLSNTCTLYTGSNSAYADVFGRPVTLYISNIDTRYLLAAFYGLSAFLQSLSVSSFGKSLSHQASHVTGYIERCFTDPLIMIILCAQVGIMDINIVVSTACSMMFCTVFGMITEVLFEDDSDRNYFLLWEVAQFHFYAIAHFVGWIALVVAFSPIILTLSTLRTCFMHPDVFGDLIITVVLMETLCFVAIQFIQFYSLKYKPRHKKEGNSQDIHNERVLIAVTAEYAIVIMRIISGFMLGTLVYAANLV
jgi:hypothetical protein